MNQTINANILAQMANNEIENENVLELVGRDLNNATIENESFTALDKIRAVNSLKVVMTAAVEALRPLAKEQFEQLFGANCLGDRTFRNGIFRRYDTFTYTWENVRMGELTAEQKEKMTAKEIESYEKTRATLNERNELYKQVKELEKEMAELKPRLKGLNETLAAMLPESKAIKRKTVFQVL